MSGSLDRFLGGSEEEPNDLAPEPAAPEPEPQEQEPEVPEPEPEPEGQAPAEPEEPQARDQKGRFVPLRAVEDERGKRQAAEAERDRLRAEVEAIRRQQQAPQQPQIPQRQMTEQEAFYQQLLQDAAAHAENQRIIRHLNKSEARVRKEFPAEVVDAAVEAFKQAKAHLPSLEEDLFDHPDPYRWVVERADHFREATEFARNPEAVLARKQAEWEAARGAAPAAPRVSPAAGMQPSVGRARSVAGRMVVDDSDMSLGDILRR